MDELPELKYLLTVELSRRELTLLNSILRRSAYTPVLGLLHKEVTRLLDKLNEGEAA